MLMLSLPFRCATMLSLRLLRYATLVDDMPFFCRDDFSPPRMLRHAVYIATDTTINTSPLATPRFATLDALMMPLMLAMRFTRALRAQPR